MSDTFNQYELQAPWGQIRCKGLVTVTEVQSRHQRSSVLQQHAEIQVSIRRRPHNMNTLHWSAGVYCSPSLLVLLDEEQCTAVPSERKSRTSAASMGAPPVAYAPQCRCTGPSA